MASRRYNPPEQMEEAAKRIQEMQQEQARRWQQQAELMRLQAVTELEDAKKNVELAVLSAIEHGQNADIPLVSRIASAAIVASADIDAETSKLYHDLIRISLSANILEALETTMNSLGYEYQSDFARRYVAQGRAEMILKLLALRFGPLPEAAQTRVRCAQAAQLDIVAERILTAQSREEVLAPLY